MSTLPLLLAFAVGLALGWIVGLRLGRASEAPRVAAAEQAASRIPHLEDMIAGLRTELSTTQAARAASDTLAQRVPTLEGSLLIAQRQLIAETQAKRALEANAASIAALEARITEERARADALQTALSAAEQENARLNTQVQETRKRAQEQLALFEQAQTVFRATFQALASEALRNNNRALGLIRFRGHFPKGGYDVQNGIKQSGTAGTASVHRRVHGGGGQARVG